MASNIKNAFGLSMEISNHPVYLQVANNYSPIFDSSYEEVELRVSNLATTIGLHAGEGIDRDKIKLYSKTFILGLPDGGESTLKHVNGRIAKDKKKVSELEIMVYRLKNIVSEDDPLFSEEIMQELRNLFGNNNELPESCIVRISYVLEMIANYLLKTGKYSEEKIIDFIVDEAAAIGDRYKETKQFKLSPRVYALIQEIVKNVPNIPLELQDFLNRLIGQYNANEIDHDKLVGEISNLALYEKKNKHVR